MICVTVRVKTLFLEGEPNNGRDESRTENHTMGNKQEVRPINKPSLPSTSGKQVKLDDADDAKRVGSKPQAKAAEEVEDRPGAATAASLQQSQDGTRAWKGRSPALS